MLAYLNPAANVCWHIPEGTRVTFITASERSGGHFSEVILTVFGTNCSKQWGPREAKAMTGKEQTIGSCCRAFWSWGLNSVCLQTSDAGTVSRLWQFQPLQHLWKGIVARKAQIKHKLLVLYICSLLPPPIILLNEAYSYLVLKLKMSYPHGGLP